MDSITQPGSVLSIIGGITFLAIIYILVTSSGTSSVINSLAGGYSGAIKAATGH